MKTIKILGLAGFFIIFGLTLSACGQNNVKKDIAKNEKRGFAVMELFTSEGCSSCPPADEVLAQIQKEAAGKPVYLLAYHVDYWDRQGWKDIFSNAAYTQRQAKYAEWLHTPQIYTPQVVVNGRTEFVGSEETTVRRVISSALAGNAAVQLTLHATQDQRRLNVHYEAAGAPSGSSILIAVVEKNAKSKVERGENAGRLLLHAQIVRKLQSKPLSVTGEGTVTVDLPKDFGPQNFEILGLIQDEKTGEIAGASRAELDTALVQK